MDTQNNNNDTIKDKSNAPVQKEQANQILRGVLAYLGLLVIVPYITMKDDPFVKFHIKQGLVLVVIEVALWILVRILYFGFLGIIFHLANIALLILSILGIINVLNKKQKMLPFVGDFTKHFTF